VLDLVEQIPPGRVMAYSDVAEAVGGGGPRHVGHALARFGSGVPWWRVLRADGSCAEVHADEQLGRLRDEGVPMVGRRVDLGRARWTP
jgi:alkylated DNA nucleotide flippase Atl1